MAAPRELHLTAEAQADLSAILDYIGASNPMAAGATGAKFDELFRGISIAPGSGRRSVLDEAVRWRTLGRYIVYYEFDEPNDRVFVIGIIHGARVHHRMRGHKPPSI